MQKIYKYKLNLTENQEIEIPYILIQGRVSRLKEQVLKIDIQDDSIYMWCMVDLDKYEISRNITIVGTGLDADHVDVRDYIGTVQLNGYVWHIFGY